jgi:Zn ribbon nucleic-acid-binding protein
VVDVRDQSNGLWSIHFEDRWPDTRFPTFAGEINLDRSQEVSAREVSESLRALLRGMLRIKLWICPLCQKRALIRRLVDTEASRVECHRCGRFEIDSDVLELLRSGYEEGDERIAKALPRLSEAVRAADSPPSLSMDTWQGLAGE